MEKVKGKNFKIENPKGSIISATTEGKKIVRFSSGSVTQNNKNFVQNWKEKKRFNSFKMYSNSKMNGYGYPSTFRSR